MLLNEFLQFSGGACLLGLQPLDAGLFVGEEAGNDQRRGQQVHLVLPAPNGQVRRLVAPVVPALIGPAGLGGLRPAIGGDEMQVVLHGLRPVVHQPLIEVVGVKQGQAGEALQQVLRHGFNDLLGVGARLRLRRRGPPVGLDSPKAPPMRLAPSIEDGRHTAPVGAELPMPKDGGLDFGSLNPQRTAPFAAVDPLEQSLAQRGENLPVGAQRIDVAVGDAAAQMRA